MGEKDISEKFFEAYNDVFADIVNVLLFDGKEVVNPDELEEQTPRAIYKAGGELHELERDVAKRWKNGDVRIACIGFENQTASDADMPFRVIGYDGAEYRAQLNRGEERYPVVTLVLCFGNKGHWNKPLNLKGCFDVPDELQPFVSDYKINLFEIAYLDDEKVNLFKSDFREIADYFMCERKGIPYKGSKRKLKHAMELFQFLAALRNDPRYEEICNDNEKGVPQTMDAALDRIINKGRVEGRAEGENTILTLMQKLLNAGRYGDAQKATDDPVYRNKLLAEYGLS